MTARYLSILFNIIWFQVCWFACVLIGNKAAIVILIIIVCAYTTVKPLRSEWPLIVGISLLGLVVDISLIKVGVLNQASTTVFPPLWLSVLWLVFATTINHSLKALMGKQLIFLALAFTGGPLCYQLGVNLTDMQFGFHFPISLMILACVWLIAGFIILKIYESWRNVFTY